jgi:hypothetical protein
MKNEPAFPGGTEENGVSLSPMYTGLTKREYFAALAMQGLLTREWKSHPAKHADRNLYIGEIVAPIAARAADALIKELMDEL